MSSLATVMLDEDRLMVSGDLNFQSVVPVWEASLAFLNQFSSLKIDFSGVTSSNSAGLALIIEWLKWGREHGKTVSLAAIPTEIHSLANVCGVAQFL